MKFSTNSSMGFTLIELLVVIAIIGILASVMIPRFNVVRAKAVDANIRSSMSVLTEAGELYLDDNGDYEDWCTKSDIIRSLEEAAARSTNSASNYKCYDDVTGFAASVPLKVQNQVATSSGTDYLCVEARTSPGLFDNDLTPGAINCN